MVWPIATLLLGQSSLTPCAGMSLAQLSDLLQQKGFSVSTDARRGIPNAIERGSTRVACSVLTNGEHQLIGLQLFKFYSVEPGVSTNELEDAIELPGTPAVARVRASLGGNVRATFVERFEGLSQERLVADLNAYFYELEKLQGNTLKRYGYPQVEQNPPPPDAHQVVHYLDGGDLNYLVKAWGWPMKANGGGSSPGWICPAVIDHALYWLSEVPNRTGDGASAGFEVSLPLTGGQSGTSAPPVDLGWATFIRSGETATVTRWVSLKGGRTLQDIHDELQDFARKCVKLAHDQGLKIAPDPNSKRGSG